MEQIFKYPVPVTNYTHFTLDLPLNYQILTVQIQDDDPYIWAIVNTAYEKTEAHFRIYGTGFFMKENENEKRGMYVGTFQRGPFVYHLFHVMKAVK